MLNYYNTIIIIYIYHIILYIYTHTHIYIYTYSYIYIHTIMYIYIFVYIIPKEYSHDHGDQTQLLSEVLWTNWTADCMVQLGGCAAKTQGVGIDIAFTEGYAKAVAEKENVWSVT